MSKLTKANHFSYTYGTFEHWSDFVCVCVCIQEWFAVYVELNQQIAALLSAGEEEEVVELKALQQQLSDVCYQQAAQLESRQNVLQAAQCFHSTTQEVTHTPE